MSRTTRTIQIFACDGCGKDLPISPVHKGVTIHGEVIYEEEHNLVVMVNGAATEQHRLDFCGVACVVRYFRKTFNEE